MSQIDMVLSALKRLLKANGMTYADVAKKLDLSEASVKRLFSQNTLSLDRLEQICSLMEMELIDLLQEVASGRRHLSELTVEQEQELVGDVALLLVAHLVINGWKFDDILHHYKFSQPELIRCMVRLQKTGILELLPMNKIKLTVSPQFSWRRGGPVQQFFLKNFLQDFFYVPFTGSDRVLCAMSGMLTQQSQNLIVEKIKELEMLYTERVRYDAKAPIEDRVNCGCVLAARPWLSKLYDSKRL